VGGELYCSLILGKSFSIVFENHGHLIPLPQGERDKVRGTFHGCHGKKDACVKAQGFVKNQYVRN
jgi:hypothetical protein